MLSRFITRGEAGGPGEDGDREAADTSRPRTHTQTHNPPYSPAAAAAARARRQEAPWRSSSSETRRPRSGRSVGRQAAEEERRPQRGCRRQMLPGGFMAHSAPGRRGGRPAGGSAGRGVSAAHLAPDGLCRAEAGVRQAAPRGGTRPSGSSLRRYGRPLPQREGGRVAARAHLPLRTLPARLQPPTPRQAQARRPRPTAGARVGAGPRGRCPLCCCRRRGGERDAPAPPQVRTAAGHAASPSCDG